MQACDLYQSAGHPQPVIEPHFRHITGGPPGFGACVAAVVSVNLGRLGAIAVCTAVADGIPPREGGGGMAAFAAGLGLLRLLDLLLELPDLELRDLLPDLE